MSECLVCGHHNQAGAQVCNMCGEVLVKRVVTAREQQHLLKQGGQDARPGVTLEQSLRIHAGRARRFMFTALVLLGLLTATPFALLYYLPQQHMLTVSQHTLIWLCIFYAMLVHAYLLGKTAESVGVSFWSSFVMAMLPPLIPAAWARVGGGSMLRPYVWLAIDGALIALAWYTLRQWPWALPVVVLLIGPLAISQLFGCVVGNLAQALGLNNMLAVGWICVAPLVLFAIMAFDLGLHDLLLDWASQPRLTPTLMLRDMGDFMQTNAAPSQVQMILLGWLALTVVIWLKTIYDNLKNPLVDG